MSAYVIDYSDPLRAGFSIPAGGFNGPGGSSANTTLRLYGRGALEWGEAVNEDLVRLTENFASASPPSLASSGQLWAETSLYYHDDNQPLLSGWYFYDINSVAVNKWTLVAGTGVIPSTAPLTPVEGQYYYSTVGGDPGSAPFAPLGTLFGFYSLGRYEPATWVSRSYSSGAGAPTASVRPGIRLRVFDKASSSWDAPSVISITASTAPSDPSPGMFWYNKSTGNLSLYTVGGTWQEIAGPSNGITASRASGPLEMGDGATNYQIKNVLNPTDPQDVATKAYVDAAVVGGVGGASFLPLTGGTLAVTGAPGLTIHRTNAATNSVIRFQTTGTSVFAGLGASSTFAVGSGSDLTTGTWLTLSSTTASFSGLVSSGSMSTSGTGTIGTSLSVGTSLTVGTTFAASGTGSFGGQLNMNSFKIVNLATGTNPNDAVNKSQMDTAIAAGVGGAATPVIFSSGTYKAGDIAILSGPTRIYIASGAGSGAPPGGNWRQVFPAVYA